MLQKQREPSTVLQKQREHYPAMENGSSAGCKSHLQVETVRPHVHLVCILSQLLIELFTLWPLSVLVLLCLLRVEVLVFLVSK